MEIHRYEMIPVPKELFESLGIIAGTALEIFADGSRIIVQKSDREERCCDDDGEDCGSCPYCCPSCGECMWEQINHVGDKEGEDD